MQGLLTRLLFCNRLSHKCSTDFSAWCFIETTVNSMAAITLGMSMKFLTSSVIKASLKQKPTVSWSKKASDLIENVCQSAECEVARVENGIFCLQLCDGISCHGMLWQILWTAMFKDLIVKIGNIRNMSREQLISIEKDGGMYFGVKTYSLLTIG